jgi:HK97 family phage prohead protease
MIEIRDAGAHYWRVAGSATTWGRPYFINDPSMGTFLEQMARNPFVAASEGREPVELHREHAPDSPVYARTSDGTMRFEDRDDGLLLAAALSKADPATVAVVSEMRADRLKGLSVGMTVMADHWGTSAADNRTALRTITSASLREVSFVQRPANPDATVVSLRHEQRGAGARPMVEYRSVPVVLAPGVRQPWANQHGASCATCAGSGVCPDCEGAGWNPHPGDDEGDDGTEGRRTRTSAEVAALGRQGLALDVGGGKFAWPIEDPTDLKAAITSFGRAGSSAGAGKVRDWIIRRARELHRIDLLPASWGTTRSVTAPSFEELEAEFVALGGKPLKRRALPPSRLGEFEAELAVLAAKA